MVSTTRWDSSSGSSSSSYGGSWDPGQDLKNGGVMGKRGQTFAEPLSAEHEREVARRVLEDLETLYHDCEDESDESGDDFDWDSEWGSEVSSCDGRDKRSAGGMTLEELAVAVNAIPSSS
ncbi:uncharacterized protein KRP23_8437 [Phytophthora ramorum]|uniref:uncharacterized protein n=1 Tax=Phytophthora ramorum TaxID=164328 RepID=UPI0030B5FC92|nr:hypothetical protein KRP23_8437 [Phytophthora ramorum]